MVVVVISELCDVVDDAADEVEDGDGGVGGHPLFKML